MRNGLAQQKLAVDSGLWSLYRYNPDKIALGENPLTIDSKEPTKDVVEYAYNENRYKQLLKADEARAEALMKKAVKDVQKRNALYKQLAELDYSMSKED